MNEEPIDRHDLEALKDWIKAEFRTVGVTLDAMSKALTVAEGEREKKDAELNDVRLRFIPREVFESYKAEQETRRRSTNLSLATIALTMGGLVIAVISLIAR